MTTPTITKDHIQAHYATFYSAQKTSEPYSTLPQTNRGKILAPEDIDQALPLNTDYMTDFASAEVYFQYQKAKIIAKHNCPRFRKSDDPHPNMAARDAPREVKRNGKVAGMKAIIHGFNMEGEAWDEWQSKIVKILYFGNFCNFQQRPKAWEQLDKSGSKFLIEACPDECECSCGIGKQGIEAFERENRGAWKANLLGKALMRVRSDLRVLGGKDKPTLEQLREVESIANIDDGRNWFCTGCHGSPREDAQGCQVLEDGQTSDAAFTME